MTALKTDDVKLASYLSLIGYGDPSYTFEGKTTKYVFTSVTQRDILNFYNKSTILIAPLLLFEKQNYLLTQGKILSLKISSDVFGSVS